MLNRNQLLRRLRKEVEGESFVDPKTIAKYATDDSIFQIEPMVVVMPRHEADLQAIVGIASDLGIGITARGGGTSTAGQAIGSGIALDFTRHFGKFLGMEGESALVGSGMNLSKLQQRLAKKGGRIGPDPSSAAWCTVGGMVGNNASGPHTLAFGSIRDHVEDLRVVLQDGTVAWTSSLGLSFQKLKMPAAPKSPVEKNSSGYALSCLRGKLLDITGLMVGSEGTLSLCSQVRLRTIPLPDRVQTIVFRFDSLEEACRAATELRKEKPVSIELADHWLIEAMNRTDSSFCEALGLLDAEVSLWVEWEDRSKELSHDGFALKDDAQSERLWKLRSSASKLLHAQEGARRPLRCIEDGVVPVKSLSAYASELRDLLKRNDVDGSIFGHAGNGHLHVNPNIDVTKPHLAKRIERLMDEAHQLVWKFGGSISGEHGDGILRATAVREQWGDSFKQFQRIKSAFDPLGIFNPGKKGMGGIAKWPEFNAKTLKAPSVRLPAPCLHRT